MWRSEAPLAVTAARLVEIIEGAAPDEDGRHVRVAEANSLPFTEPGYTQNRRERVSLYLSRSFLDDDECWPDLPCADHVYQSDDTRADWQSVLRRCGACSVLNVVLLSGFASPDIDLSGCSLYYLCVASYDSDLPGGLFLASIRCLKFCCPCTESLPEQVGVVSLLREMELVRCDKLVSLPDDLSALQSLERLKISECNRLTCVSESVGTLRSLKILSVYACRSITSLPGSISQLCSLQELNLRCVDGLRSLPSDPWPCSLRILNINNCGTLREIPESLRSARSLKELGISKNRLLAVLPDVMGDMCDLERVDVEGCCLENMPESLLSSARLKKATISDLGMTHVPRLAAESEIRELSLQRCHGLTCFPDTLDTCIHLSALWISGLRNVLQLPESLGQIPALAKLEIHDCNLLSLPRTLFLSSSLKELEITVCGRLVSIPGDLRAMEKLATLAIYHCESFVGFAGDFEPPLSLTRFCVSDCSSFRHLSYPAICGQKLCLTLQRCRALETIDPRWWHHSGLIDAPSLFRGVTGVQTLLRVPVTKTSKTSLWLARWLTFTRASIWKAFLPQIETVLLCMKRLMIRQLPSELWCMVLEFLVAAAEKDIGDKLNAVGLFYERASE